MSHTSFGDWVDSMKGVAPNLPGCARLEKLPNEILRQILEHVTMPETTQKSRYMMNRLPVNPNTPVQKTDLFACLMTSHRLFEVALLLTYRCPKVANFDKFLVMLSDRPQYHALIRSIDLSAARATTSLLYLSNCLAFAPGLKRLSVPLDAFKPRGTARSIFFGFPQLECIEIIDRYRDDWDLIITASEFAGLSPTTMSSITTLSLNKVQFGNILQNILPRCPNLRILDLKSCCFDAQSLFSLHPDVRLTQLILEECQELKGDEVAEFLAKHLAVTSTLEVLNLGRMLRGYGSSLEAENVTTILDSIPTTLRSLDLGGAIMDVRHIPLLQRLSTQLEELGLGHWLEDVEDILLGSRYDLNETMMDIPADNHTSTEPQLATISNAVSAVQLQQRMCSLSIKNGTSKASESKVRHLDLRNSSFIQVAKLRRCLLLGPQSLPLNRIELHHSIMADIQELKRICAAVGWKVEWVGSRIWVERK